MEIEENPAKALKRCPATLVLGIEVFHNVEHTLETSQQRQNGRRLSSRGERKRAASASARPIAAAASVVADLNKGLTCSAARTSVPFGAPKLIDTIDLGSI
jgi:hypothetical protein